MTQIDSKRKKGKDNKRKPPDRNQPPPANYQDEESSGDFNVINMALWAGDFETANEILEGYALASGTSISPFEHPVLASIQRLHRQLVRRLNEYTTLAESADLPIELYKPNNPLKSGGGRLRAIIWAESERDYELRCYLRILSWEQNFYKRAAQLASNAGVVNATALAARRGYGLEQSHKLADEAGEDKVETGLAWAATTGTMFLQSEVSDFCTCSVRGVWTATELPAQAEDVVRIFQDFLNDFDPKAL